MDMTGTLFSVPMKDLEEILCDSSLLEHKICSENTETMSNLLDLDKSWEAIFYLLTGHPVVQIGEPQHILSWTLFSGQIVDEEQDLGYGPAHYLTTEQVRKLNAELDKISYESLMLKYDGKAMNDAGIYPEVWDHSDSLDYVLFNFEQLKHFYKLAEAENRGVISFIN
jgi:hypothetical protein